MHPELLRERVVAEERRNFVEVAARHGAIHERLVTVEAVRPRLDYA